MCVVGDDALAHKYLHTHLCDCEQSRKLERLNKGEKQGTARDDTEKR